MTDAATRRQRRQRVIRRVRDAIWGMRHPEDMEGLLTQIRARLIELDIPLLYCGVNIVDVDGEAASVVSHSMNPQGVWHRLQSQGSKTVLGFWQRGQVAYRRDLAHEDPHGEHRIFPTVGCIIDVPFSHGTLAASSRQANAFTDEDVEVLEDMATVLEDGFRRLEELKRIQVRLRVRERVWRMRRAEDVVDVMAALREGFAEVGLRYTSCGINLVHPEQGFVVTHTMERGTDWMPTSVREPQPIVERFWREGQLAYRRDLQRDDSHGELRWLPYMFGQPIRCVIDIPFSHGTLALNSTEPETFSDEQVGMLQDLAGVLEEGFRRMDDLRALEERNAELEREVGERRRAEAELERSLAEKVVLLKEVHHRVKNNLQVVSSLLSLRAEAIDDPQILRAFDASRAQIQSMALIHERLYESPDLAHIDCGEYVRGLAQTVFSSYGVDPEQVTLVLDTEAHAVSVDTAIHCGLIVHELLSNSLKYAFPDGRPGTLRLEARPVHPRLARLRVSDDGVGLPPHVDPVTARSLGLRLVGDLARRLQGTVEVDRRDGTSFLLQYPLGG